ncbi:unnamed protein product [Caenorhabditis angaria]|uniref:Tyrosine-protein phosphatase domain-containing protein n=1 Tax=Caenorhabditis angaria TaxID=860376 RepID=A0A9P1IHV6_9PELO|nr:unnamed protein product [Caenorhabditis angaria]
MPTKIKLKQQNSVSKAKASQMKKNKSAGGINRKFQDQVSRDMRSTATKSNNDRTVDIEQPTQNNLAPRAKPAPPPAPPARIESQYKPPPPPPAPHATSPVKQPAAALPPPPKPPAPPAQPPSAPPPAPQKDASYYTQLTAPPPPMPPDPPALPAPQPPPPKIAPPVIITVPDPPRLPPPPIPVPLPPAPHPPAALPPAPHPPPQVLAAQQPAPLPPPPLLPQATPQPVPPSPVPLFTPPPAPIPNPHAGGASAPQPPLPPRKQHSEPGAMANFNNAVILPGMRAVVQAFQPIINHDKPAEKAAEKGGNARKLERAELQEEQSSTNEEVDRSQLVPNWVKKTLENGISALKKEYWETPNEAPIEKAATFKENPTKNRYWNIACNDATRFRLADQPTYYIHANYVGSALSNPRRFLCAQAPLVATVEDFWRMVIVSGTEFIVMLCDLVEKGKQKSAEYFPQKIGETMNIGMYCSVVKEHFQELDKTVTSSKFRVTLTETGAVSTLKHLHWHNWPDHGAPDSFVSPFRVIMQVRRSRRPILVHCSAGVGRTGTLVLIATILESIKSADFPGVPKVLAKMREERFKCVQTEIQYLYVHRCLIEYLVLKNMCPNYSKDLLKKFRDDYDQIADKYEKA